MLIRKFEPTKPYRYAKYGRMSGSKQNPRSPDQQFDTIEEVKKRLAYPWPLIRTYRDDALSGRLMRKRPGFQAMLRDIELGIIQIDLIVVDTLERLGRSEEIAELRRKLYSDHGVLVVTADSSFADPTGPTGKALAMMENVRGTEDTRIKCHNVIRGKKDTVRRKRWPGGNAPIGFRLRGMIDESVTPPKPYNILEPIPEHIAAVLLAFHRAADLGHGCGRLTRWWNQSNDIPAELKPMYPATMRYMLKNEIYVGRLVWGRFCTDVVNDTAVKELNPNGPHVIRDDFCDPVMEGDLFDRVQKQRLARGAIIREQRAAKAKKTNPEKLIHPLAPGLVLVYLLAGLVRCGHCKSAMRPIPSGRQSKDGRKYVYFTCLRAKGGACPNSRSVHEGRLTESVLARIRQRLFPPPEREGQVPDWFPQIVALVEEEIARYRVVLPDLTSVREAEIGELAEKQKGWLITLGNPDLPTAVRGDIIAHYDRAKARHAELEAEIRSSESLDNQIRSIVDPAEVLEGLRNLANVMSGHNVTIANLELSKHIDKILCYPDGRVEMRGTWLGLFDGAVEMLHRAAPHELVASSTNGNSDEVKPRKRARLRIPGLSSDNRELAENDSCLDPSRFDGLPDSFFWKESPAIECPKGWAHDHADEVAEARCRGLTHAELAGQFEVSIPTIRKALRIAKASFPALAKLPRKLPCKRWADSHYEEVWRLKAKGQTQKQISLHFRKSIPLIAAALRFAAKMGVSTEQPQSSDTAPRA